MEYLKKEKAKANIIKQYLFSMLNLFPLYCCGPGAQDFPW